MVVIADFGPEFGVAQRLLLAYEAHPFEDYPSGREGECRGDADRLGAFLSTLRKEDEDVPVVRWVREAGPGMSWYDNLLPYAERVLGLPGLPQVWEYERPDAPEAEKMADPAYRDWRESRDAALAAARERWES